MLRNRGEHIAEPREWFDTGAFAGRKKSSQYRRRLAACALGDWLWRLGRRFHSALAGVFQAHIPDHSDRGSDIVVAFAGLFRDQAQILTAIGAVLFRFGYVVHDSFADQVGRQRLATGAFYARRSAGFLAAPRLSSPSSSLA